MISVQDWALIRQLVAEGVSQRQVARDLGVARKTVARAVASPRPPRYERVSGPNVFAAFEPRVRALLSEYPSMPAPVIAQRVGWSGSITWFRDNVRTLRPLYRPVDPADRLVHELGDQAQCDLWFPPVTIDVGGGAAVTPPVLVMVPTGSRFSCARMLPSRTTPDLLAGMWSLIAEQISAVPRRLVWDNEAGIGRGGRLAHSVTGFVRALATRIVQVKPYDPESKGVVERANQFLETSFLPGRAFTCAQDFNSQLEAWLPVANSRTVKALGARPVDVIDADRAAMLPLPPVPPPVGWSRQIRLGRDYYVSVAGNDYSVHPGAIGRLVDIHADLTTVTVRVTGRVVAEHARSWARATTITDPEHVDAAAVLRQVFQNPSPRPVEQDLIRDLTDYDLAFGIEFDPVAS